MTKKLTAFSFCRTLFVALWASIFISPEFCSGAPIIVNKEVRDNPTISCEVVGDPALNTEIRRFLAVCGWFDPVGGKSDYQLKVKSNSVQVAVDLSMSDAPIGNWQLSASGDKRLLAKKIVDLIIERSFKDLKVRGFCESRIAFCTETSKGVRNIYICDIDGNNITQLTHFKGVCVEPCWTPEAKSVCYSKYSKTGIDVIETTTGSPARSRILSAAKGINSGVAVSPNGKEMALILSLNRQVDLYTVPIGSNKRTRLTKGISVEASPCWNPAGTKLAYVSDSGGAPRVFICNRDGSGMKKLPSIGSDAVTPDWSGDDRIVYAAKVSGSYTLGVYDLKTGHNTRVTEASGNFESPAWAPDNRQVVCKQTVGGKSRLAVVDTRTGKVRPLISSGYNLSMPTWSPCKAK